MRHLLALFLLLVSGVAGAVQCPTYGSIGGGGSFATREAAYAACTANPSPVIRMSFGGFVYGQFGSCVRVGTENGYRRQYVEYLGQDAGGACVTSGTQRTQNSSLYSWTSECPAGSTWNDATKTCHNQQQCLAKPSLPRGAVQGGTTLCHENCTFEPTGTSLGMGNITYADGWKPSGAACTLNQPPKPNKPQECAPVAGQTVCLKETGEYCATASTGKQICWQPGETGEKTTENVKQKRDAGPSPIPPNLSLPNGDTLTQSGDPMTTTITKSNSPGGPTTTITTTTTNYVTTNGTNAGTGNSGEPSDGTGSGDDEGEGEGPGEPGEGVGDLYEDSDKTVGEVFAAFKTRIENAPIVSAASGYLTVSVGGGCPVWTTPAAPPFWDAMAFNFHCSGAFADVLALCGWVLLAVAAFQAFKIGFY